MSQKKPSLIFQNIEIVVRRARSDKKGVYTGLIAILNSIKSSYPDKAKIDSKVREIQDLAKGTDF